jgi:hypothetical protein
MKKQQCVVISPFLPLECTKHENTTNSSIIGSLYFVFSWQKPKSATWLNKLSCSYVYIFCVFPVNLFHIIGSGNWHFLTHTRCVTYKDRPTYTYSIDDYKSNCLFSDGNFSRWHKRTRVDSIQLTSWWN